MGSLAAKADLKVLKNLSFRVVVEHQAVLLYNPKIRSRDVRLDLKSRTSRHFISVGHFLR